MEPEPLDTLLPWDTANEVSRNDLSPTSIHRAGSAAKSSIVGDGGYAKQLAHSTAATHQSSNDREEGLAVEDNIQYIGGGIGSKDANGKPADETPEESGPELRPAEGLEARLRKAMRESTGKETTEKRFVPIDDIDRILDNQSVLRELKTLSLSGNQDLRHLAYQICSVHTGKRSPRDDKETQTTRRRIFATLVLMEEAKAILEVVREGLYDWDLPLVSDSTDPVRPRLAKQNNDKSISPVAFSKDWSAYKHGVFANCQWQLSSPCFEMRTQVDAKINHYRLHPHSILPITEVEGNDRHGGFSSVSKIKMHPAHRNLMAKEASSTNSWLALKKLRFSTEDAFRKEVAPLKRLGNNENPHIIQLLTTFHYQDDYNLVFQWADGGNLFDFWTAFPEPHYPPRDHGLCKWLANQLTGLASALSLIHKCEVDPRAANMSDLNSRGVRQKYGTHGDLKPENILWFKSVPNSEGPQDLGTFKISDFGLTSFHSLESRQLFVPQGVSASYRAPEYDLDGRISQKYDMWSLGCVLTELLTWFLLGSAGVSAFGQKRMQEIKPKFKEDSFFILTENSISSPLGGAKAKHFDMLRDQPNCSDFISELIDFVQDKLLRMAADNRCEVSEFLRFAKDVSQKCAEDEAYCTERLKPIRKRGTDLSEICSRFLIGPNETIHQKRASLNRYPGPPVQTSWEARRVLAVSQAEDAINTAVMVIAQEEIDPVRSDSLKKSKEVPELEHHNFDKGFGDEKHEAKTQDVQDSNANELLNVPGRAYSREVDPGSSDGISREPSCDETTSPCGHSVNSFHKGDEKSDPSEAPRNRHDDGDIKQESGCLGLTNFLKRRFGRRRAKVRGQNPFGRMN
ncbi:kinase-like domain-containing protein [Pestalotiopsis sp. NC0098]|nr:kinase-like domain-containing protein [Pestalotiopsis sp. NC0098]